MTLFNKYIILNKYIKYGKNEEAIKYINNNIIPKLSPNNVNDIQKILMEEKTKPTLWNLDDTNKTPIEKIINFLSRNNRVLIIKAGTGSGKTTVIPICIYDAGLVDKRKIICTQPRQYNTESTSKFVGTLTGTDINDKNSIIGYKHGSERQISKRAKIIYATEGILVREIIADIDKFAKKYKYLIIDEVHERNLETDILLAISKYLLNSRTDIRIIVMSATFDPLAYAKYFDVDKQNIFEIAGTNSKITDYYIDSNEVIDNYINKTCELAINIHEQNQYDLTTPSSVRDIIIFVDGMRTISNIRAQLTKILLEKVKIDQNKYQISILDLHSKSTEFDKKLANGSILDVQNNLTAIGLQTPPNRRIIIATNTAETGITFKEAKYVIDTGWMNVGVYDPIRNAHALIRTRVSQDNMVQRRGRVGRVADGCFYPIYSIDVKNSLREYKIPTINISNLDTFCLFILNFMKKIGDDYNQPIDISKFKLFENPPDLQLISSLNRLYQLGAIDKQLYPNTIGEKMLLFKYPPHFSKALLSSAYFGCSYEIAILIASSVFEQSIYTHESLFLNKFRYSTNTIYNSVIDNKFGSDHINILVSILQFFNYKRIGTSKDDVKKWCEINILNYKLLVLIEQELLTILNTMVDNNIPILSINLLDGTVNKDKVVKILRALFSGLFINIGTYNIPSEYIDTNTIRSKPSQSLFYTNDNIQNYSKYLFYDNLFVKNKGGVYEYNINGISQYDPTWIGEITPNKN